MGNLDVRQNCSLVKTENTCVYTTRIFVSRGLGLEDKAAYPGGVHFHICGTNLHVIFISPCFQINLHSTTLFYSNLYSPLRPMFYHISCVTDILNSPGLSSISQNLF